MSRVKSTDVAVYSLRLPVETYQRLAAMSEAERVPLAWQIRKLIEEALAAREATA